MAGSNGHSRDDGAESELRARPCIRTTWCVLQRDHVGECLDVPRQPQAPTDFGPNRNRNKR